MKDRIKEIKYLIYLKSIAIKQEKKELKELSRQLKDLEGQQTLRRKRK